MERSEPNRQGGSDNSRANWDGVADLPWECAVTGAVESIDLCAAQRHPKHPIEALGWYGAVGAVDAAEEAAVSPRGTNLPGVKRGGKHPRLREPFAYQL